MATVTCQASAPFPTLTFLPSGGSGGSVIQVKLLVTNKFSQFLSVIFTICFIMRSSKNVSVTWSGLIGGHRYDASGMKCGSGLVTWFVVFLGPLNRNRIIWICLLATLIQHDSQAAVSRASAGQTGILTGVTGRWALLLFALLCLMSSARGCGNAIITFHSNSAARRRQGGHGRRLWSFKSD